ncbi:glycosyltransferase [Alkaliphilus transvaalensis]|uniref:glycosyltransferase n=1 Tax=Alkaliphilus transvaalensis TaxID=114628 RepID=UPI00047E89C3|nr:glycosyltransferase [Alkaliphilus transvaalensis]
MKYKKKLSVCMMVKNEEKYLEQSLLSLQPLFDSIDAELIIVDTGSEDNTVEIAKKFTQQVYFHGWNNHFGDMRNKTINYAKGEWILVLDGDEVFQNITPLINFLKSKGSSKYKTGTITIKSITNEKDTDIHQSVDILRLFKNSKGFYYKGSIHEQPHFQLPVFFTNAEVIHYGYVSTDKELMEYKFRRNVELLEKELEENPNDIYNLFQLAQSYGMYKDFKKSLEYISKAYELVEKYNMDRKAHLYVYNYLARAYLNNNKFFQLETICLEAIELEKDFIDFYYYLGVAQSRINKDEEALESFHKYLELLVKYQNATEEKFLTLTKVTLGLYEEVYFNLCILYNRLGNKEVAINFANKITKDHMEKRKIPILVELYLGLEKYEELKIFYRETSDDNKEVLNIFWNSLENIIEMDEYSEKKEEVFRLFSQGSCQYSLLNKARLIILENWSDIPPQLIEEAKSLKYNSLPIFFADMIYLLLKNRTVNIGELFSRVREELIEGYIQYLIKKYDDIVTVMDIYLNNMDQELRSLQEIKFQRLLKKNILFSDDIQSPKYEETWHSYLVDGIYYISQVYKDEIIKNEMIYDVKNDEHAFLLYMLIADKNKKNNTLEYVKYLRKALKIYYPMKKGIEILLQEVKDIENNKNNQLDQYKKQVKKNIKELINNAYLEQALELINEYDLTLPGDIEVISMKAVIFIMQGNYNEAHNVLLQGLEIKPNHYDLLYNLKYVYEILGERKKALETERKLAFSMNTMRYINPEISIVEFFSALKEEGIRYVVLRGFENLPTMKEGEDLDILVHDEDIVKISKYFIPNNEKGAVQCDMYTPTPYSCSSYAGLPYYPRKLADKILANRVIYNDIVYVPSMEVHFYSLIFHVVFHKAERSMIPVDRQSALGVDLKNNKYYKTLSALAKDLNIKVNINLQDLKILLDQKDWKAGVDLTRKFSLVNRSPWLRKLYQPKGIEEIKDGELNVFFIREWVYKRGMKDYIVKWLDEFGYDIILVKELDEHQQEVGTRDIRGGNWDEGVIYQTGGKPCVMVVVYDHNPQKRSEDKKLQYPFVTNGNVFRKDALRAEVNRNFNSTNITNPVHSADDEIEAWEYIEILDKSLVPIVKEKIKTKVDKYKTKEKIIGSLGGFRHRAKAEIIEYKGKWAVKKTFREGKERFLEREKFAYGILSKENSLIPHLIEAGDNYIITPYYKDLLRDNEAVRSKVLKEHIKEIGSFLKYLYDRGYAHLDFHPGNFIFTEEEGLKAIDFEYLYRYDKKPKDFLKSYDIVGKPSKFNSDFPNYVGEGLLKAYDNLWKNTTGYSLLEIAKLALK